MKRFDTRRRSGGLLLAGLVAVTTACASASNASVFVRESDSIVDAPDLEPIDEQVDEPVPTVELLPDESPDERQAPVDEPLDPSTEPSDESVDEITAELQANGFCDPVDVEDEGVVTAMHFVIGGAIQDPCFVAQPGDGAADVVLDDDPRLLAAWESLTSITPIELVDDISLLAGFEPCSSCDTLAFVSALDEAGTFFIVAVDVVAAENDPDELRLTMVHELTHVFAQRVGEQIVLTDGPFGCETYFNGSGCFTEDSYMWAWIQEFWPAELLDTLPANGSVSDDDVAGARCDADPAYTGSYAAVHPEEDFAETFSAYVYDVEVDDALDEKLAFFDRYPEFVAIRENARAMGFSGTEANFDGCG